MAAKFYTACELHAFRDRAMEIAVEGVASLHKDIGLHFGQALFLACMHLYKSGPAMTYVRLNSCMKPKYFL